MHAHRKLIKSNQCCTASSLESFRISALISRSSYSFLLLIWFCPTISFLVQTSNGHFLLSHFYSLSLTHMRRVDDERENLEQTQFIVNSNRAKMSNLRMCCCRTLELSVWAFSFVFLDPFRSRLLLSVWIWIVARSDVSCCRSRLCLFVWEE